VKRRSSFIGLLLAISLLLPISLTFASDKDIVKIQGIVMEIDLNQNIMIVNERTFVWDQNTNFYNEKGSPVTVDSLRKKTWVYVEGTKDTIKKSVIAVKIYILPKYIPGNERHLYPFFQETATSKIE
jgi:hypothetical protein